MSGSALRSEAARTPEGRAGWLDVSELGLGGEMEVVAELGRGSLTAVYRVRRSGVDYALKVLRRVGAGEDEAVRAFRREAALLARVDHPGVPRVFDAGTAGGHPYLLLEFIDGQPLAGRLAEGPLPEAALVRLAADVTTALAAAHQAGLVHRDVKPANIIVTGQGRARLIDFGLAAAGRADRPKPETAVVGTFNYAAPEQTGMLARPVDGRADLYALGVVLYQAATGELPFRADDVGQLLALHATAPAPDPRGLRPDLSDRLAELIGRLLAKDPDDRVPTAEQLHAELIKLDPNALGDAGRAAPVGRASTGTLVGRDAEQAQLISRWGQARTGRGGVALITGAAGAGKSHLARAVVEAARADGALVLTGKCDRDSALPLAPLRAAVDRHLSAITALPAESRAAAVRRLRAAAGPGAALLRPLSPALATLLDAPDLAAEDRHEQFAVAVAEFLIALAREAGALLLVIDDVQWLDPASRAVLRRLEGLGETPFLLAATARDDHAGAEAVAVFDTDADAHLDLRISLAPLDVEATGHLLASYLAGSSVSPPVIAELATRGRGNPFTILEYLHALIDAGALRPSWGTWHLDTDVLRAINLPTDVLDLILARIDGLGADSRRVLVAAAAIGTTFEAGLLGEVIGTDCGAALIEAADRGLLQADGQQYEFVHDRIREALLNPLVAADRRRLHQRIAEILDAQHRTDPAGVYATAHHYAHGDVDENAERVYATGWSAGQLALTENALDAAIAFFAAAESAARTAGITPDSRYREAYGTACWYRGDTPAARGQLEPALAAETDPVRRAALLLLLAQVGRTEWDIAGTIDLVRRGLAELGSPMPRTSPVLGLTTVWLLLLYLPWWLLTGGWRPRAGTADGDEAERLRLHALLYRAGTATATIGLRTSEALSFAVRNTRLVHRLGPTAEYALITAGAGVLCSSLRLHRRREEIFRRGFEIADRLGDPQLRANLAWNEVYTRYAVQQASSAECAEVCERHRNWIELDFYLNTLLTHTQDLLARGYAAEALELCERGNARLTDPTAARRLGFPTTLSLVRTMLGEATQAPAVPAELTDDRLDPAHRIYFVATTVQEAVEGDELGQPFEAGIDALDRLGLPLRVLFPTHRIVFVHESFGRLALLQRAADGAERAERSARAQAAVRRLGRAANDPLLRGYHRVAQASLSQLRGDHEEALTLLAKAEGVLVRLDAPLVQYEAARVRARALHGLGEEALADSQSELALLLAEKHGWVRRARWVRAEFRVTDATSRRTVAHTRPNDSGADRYRRRLEALQQVSAAAASVLDPHQLARVALDEMLRILGAERAVLFLAGDDGALQPSLGRDAAGNHLTELVGYSATLVDRVAADRRPLVVTGTEEGAALGSQSALVYGLRSIIIAPLELDGRLLGVVYLDSRVAKGVFTDGDIDILTAVTSQIAVSLETARAAQLEAAVQAARRQRDTAETLRQAMNDLTATLDPEQVLDRLRDLVARALPADQVRVVHHDGDGVDVHTAALLEITEPRIGSAETAPAAVTALLGDVRGWMIAPLAIRGHGSGVLLAGSAGAEFSRAQLDVAAALTGQGATAYDNAHLFAQVQQMATTDGLTGIHNRRHFNDLANTQLSIAQRNHRPMAAVMIDIDHFKRINDTYGHGSGDEVIRAVAGVLQAQVRQPDVLGRYGGEEFAIVMSEMHGDPTVVAERLRAAVESTTIATPAGPLHTTISVGVTELKPGDDLGTVLARADEALYSAKQAGRNQVRHG